MAGHGLLELRIGLRLQRAIVSAAHLEIRHHLDAIDEAGLEVAAAAAQHHGLDRVHELAEMKAREIEHRDIGACPRRQTAKIVTPQGAGPAKRRGAIEIRRRRNAGAAIHDVADVEALAHVIDDVGRECIGAHGDVDAALRVTAEGPQRLARPREHHRTVND